MRPKLKVDCYSSTGKWKYNNMTIDDNYPILDGNLYPTLVDSYGKEPTRSELRKLQEEATYNLRKLIEQNSDKVRHLSPEKFGFNAHYIYVIELILPDHYFGFCQFIMDKT